MDGAQLGLILGTAGGVLGVLGGAVGCYFSIRNTQGPRERAFMVWASLAILAVVGGGLAASVLFGPGFRFVGLLPLLGLGPGIAWLNARQARIRREEAGTDRPLDPSGA